VPLCSFSLIKYVPVAGGYCLHHYYFHAIEKRVFHRI
jgi:hypothetical protein